MSKIRQIKLGNTVYDIADDRFTQLLASTLMAGENNPYKLVTTSEWTTLSNSLSNLEGLKLFNIAGTVTSRPTSSTLSYTDGSDTVDYKVGDVVFYTQTAGEGGLTEEWVLTGITTGTPNTASWEMLGTTNINMDTKAEKYEVNALTAAVKNIFDGFTTATATTAQSGDTEYMLVIPEATVTGSNSTSASTTAVNTLSKTTYA